MEINTYMDIFSDPESLFRQKYKKLHEIKDDCLFVLDTNVLLLPYTIGKKELDEIEKLYRSLIDNDRLLISSQVAKEFVKNRPKKLAEMYQSLSDHLSKSIFPRFPKYPMLSQLDQYTKLLDLEEQVINNVKEYKKQVKSLIAYINDLNWNDSVSKMYSNLFGEDIIFNSKWEYKLIEEELKERHKYNIPPAYKDKGKSDGGIGDYIIWKDIIRIGQEKDKDVVFVTGDEKADWFHQVMGNKLYPRFELINEFKNITNGRNVQFISFSQLLEAFKLDEGLIEGIRTVEIKALLKSNVRANRRSLKASALHKADYKCEVCGEETSDYNNPETYLEVHHKIPLSEGGQDSLDNMIVVCPSCHKKLHTDNLNESKFISGSPCQMSGQQCPACKNGLLDVDGDGVSCSNCGLFFPAI